MKKERFFLLFMLPYIFNVLMIMVAKPMGSIFYRLSSAPEELRIAEHPFRFEVPEIKKPLIPENLNAPFRIAVRHAPQGIHQKILSLPEKKPEITLVVVSEHFRLAIIDGLVLKEGDTIQSGRIIRIRDDAVVISDRGRIEEIPVPPWKP